MYFIGISWLTFAAILVVTMTFLGIHLSATVRVTPAGLRLLGVVAGLMLQLQDPRFALLVRELSQVYADFFSKT